MNLLQGSIFYSRHPLLSFRSLRFITKEPYPGPSKIGHPGNPATQRYDSAQEKDFAIARAGMTVACARERDERNKVALLHDHPSCCVLHQKGPHVLQVRGAGACEALQGRVASQANSQLLQHLTRHLGNCKHPVLPCSTHPNKLFHSNLLTLRSIVAVSQGQPQNMSGPLQRQPAKTPKHRHPSQVAHATWTSV